LISRNSWELHKTGFHKIQIQLSHLTWKDLDKAIEELKQKNWEVVQDPAPICPVIRGDLHPSQGQAVGIELSGMDYLCRLFHPLSDHRWPFTFSGAATPFGFGTSKIYGQFHLIAVYFAFNIYLPFGVANQNGNVVAINLAFRDRDRFTRCESHRSSQIVTISLQVKL
jgi:hypothetical protein